MAPLGDGRVAFTGGSFMGAKQPLSSVSIYDSKAGGKWSSLPDMLLPRDAPGTCVITRDGVSKLYAFGGVIGFPPPGTGSLNTSATVESFKLDANATKWEFEPSLPVSLTSPSVIALADGSGCIIAGGFHSQIADAKLTTWDARSASAAGGQVNQVTAPSSFAYSNKVWHFDGHNYTSLPSMPCAQRSAGSPLAECGLSNMGVALANNGVYLVGGGSMEPSYFNVSYLRLSPTVGAAWLEVAPLNDARSYIMMGTVIDPKSGEEKVVAAGGMSLQPMFEPMSSVEVYSPSKNTWTYYGDGQLGALPSAIGFGSGARLNATHMLAAGGSGPPPTTGKEALIFSL